MGRFEHLELGHWRAPRAETEQKPPDVLDQDFYLDKARSAFADEDYERALSYYSRTLQYDINIEEAWVGQLRCLIEMNELPEAVTWFNRASERFPQSAQLFSARAVAEARLGDTGTALEFSDSAFSARGINSFCWVARGDVLISVNPVNARACFAKAIELAPNDWSVRHQIARAYLVRRRYHEALDYLNQAVRLDPDRFNCWYWIGRCCDALGQNDEARTAYSRALVACPGFKPALEAIEELDRRGPMSAVVDAVKRLFGSLTGKEGKDGRQART